MFLKFLSMIVRNFHRWLIFTISWVKFSWMYAFMPIMYCIINLLHRFNFHELAIICETAKIRPIENVLLYDNILSL